ncbi:MAG TPA: glycosyltransferase, partial [Kribbella sp.]
MPDEDLSPEPFERAVACVIPAKDEADRIAATVDAVHKLIGVDLVVVVDDGSTDGTTEAAERAGAVVVRHERNRGKAAAMETG